MATSPAARVMSARCATTSPHTRGGRCTPRVLVDVSEVSTATTVLGTEVSMPLLVAPVAFQRLVDPDGEVGMARAAAAAGTIMCLSTLATAHPSEVATEAPPAPRWFQLYCFRDRGVTRSMIDEAVACGYEAIVLTVDAPRAGRRERDFRTGFALPAGIHAPAVTAAVGSDEPLTAQEVFGLVDPTLTWKELEALASDCSLPIILKGIQTGADAALAVEHGAARDRRVQPWRPSARRGAGDIGHSPRGCGGGRWAV